MKKEKQIRSYKRRTKSGKTVTVKAHTAKYDATEKEKGVAKKKGAGKELEERKKKPVQLEIPFGKEEEKEVLDEVKGTTKKESDKKVRPVGSGTNGPTPKRKSEAKVTKTSASKPATSEPAFTAAEFKEWYRGTGSAADKKVAKALRAQLGRSGYRKLEDEAIDNYSSRGHLSMFKRVSGGSGASTFTKASSVRTGGSKVAEATGSASMNAGVIKSKDVHPRKLTDEELRSKMKESKNYIFGKDGKIWRKNSRGGKFFEVTTEDYRNDLIDDYKKKKSYNTLSKIANEYGFSKGDVRIASIYGKGKTKPYRRKNEVDATLARRYAKFEDISIRQATVELMMAKPSLYRHYMKFYEVFSSEGNESKT